MHPCERCGEPIEDRYRLCYQCYTDAKFEAANLVAAASRMSSSEQTPPKPVYTPPSGVCAPNAKELAIAKAHEENILASATLCQAINDLAAQVLSLVLVIKSKGG